MRAHTLQSLRLVTVWPMFSAAMLSLITGVILGLGSKYGLVRYWWVAIKLALNIILSTLIVTALRGEVAKAADLGSQLAVGVDLDWNFSNMLYPPIVSPTALTVAFLLAIFKPWGRIRTQSCGPPADRQIDCGYSAAARSLINERTRPSVPAADVGRPSLAATGFDPTWWKDMCLSAPARPWTSCSTSATPVCGWRIAISRAPADDVQLHALGGSRERWTADRMGPCPNHAC